MASSRETISCKDGAFSAYVAAPKNMASPAILVIQEIFGVNQVMRDICDSLAEEGYWAVCPDLFWRIQPGIDITDKTDAEWEKAFSYFKTFNVDDGLGDITATLAWIRSTGISAARRAGSPCVSETARRNLCPSSVKRRIAGTMPAVLMVMARASMAPPLGCERIFAARITSS